MKTNKILLKIDKNRSNILWNKCVNILAVYLFFFPLTPVHASQHPYIAKHGIVFSSGDVHKIETDVRLNGPGQTFAFKRFYNSQSSLIGFFGYGWSGGIGKMASLLIDDDRITQVRVNGQRIVFIKNTNGSWSNHSGQLKTIVATADGYKMVEQTGIIKEFESTGQLTLITDKNGNQIQFVYQGEQLLSILDAFGKSIVFTYENNKVITLVTPIGTYTYGYDLNDNLTSVERPDLSVIRYIYDDTNDSHNLTAIIDPTDTKTQTIQYDIHDRVVTSSLTGNSDSLTIEYPSQFERKITDSLGITTTYQLEIRNGIARVSSYTGPGCSTCGATADTSYLYDDRLRVLQSTDGKSIITSFTYDESSNKLTKTVATGTAFEKTTTYTYTAENRLETITEDSIANPGQPYVTTNSYDPNGNLLRRTTSGFSGTLPISKTTLYTYNSYGQITSIDGPRMDGDVTTLSYYPLGAGDDSGNLHTVTNALDHTTTYSNYNYHGDAQTIVDVNGQTSLRSYDSRGRLMICNVSGLATSYEYNKAGELLTIIQPGNRIITYGYDTAGRVDKITDNQGNSIVYTYDSEGRKIEEQIVDPTDELQRFNNFEYDDAGRLTKVLFPGGGEQTTGYDEVGNLVQTINATGLQTAMDYDALQRLASVVEGITNTGYMYDTAGNLTQVTDAKGKVTTYGYDDFGQRLFRSSPESGSTNYSYDESGNLNLITDALTRMVQFNYDTLNRPTAQYYGHGDILFSYDQGENGIGRLSSITDELGGRLFSYNPFGQLATESRTIGSAAYTTIYDYSTITAELEAITYPSGHTVSYDRGVVGQVQSITLDSGVIISAITHLPFGPLKSATLGSTALTKGYDQRYNLQSIQAGTLNCAYVRDAGGYVTSVTTPPAPSVDNMIEEYEYNPENNQLKTKGAATYSYDAVGNILSDGVYTFTYDPLNRITEVSKVGEVIAEYGYDSSNRRISKTIGSVTTHYHYDINSQLIAETLADGTPLRDYVYLNGELIALNVYQGNSGLYYYINDHLGTPQQLVTGTGEIVWQAAYLPFGSAQLLTEQVVNNIRFPGQYFDSETGLHYNWHRFYDPETGRYISADPIGLAGGINLYAYVGGNPIGRIDPRGLEILTATGVGSAVLTGVGAVGVGAAAVVGAIAGVLTPSTLGDGTLPPGIMNEGDESNDGSQDKYLGKGDEKKLKKKLAEECDTIENLKTPGGKGAGGYDLYKKPNGDIVVKPKGGNGPGEPTGWNVRDL